MDVFGSMYHRKGRWWWSVRLPGGKKAKSMPLKAAGAKYATTDRKLAEEVAKMYWQQSLNNDKKQSQGVKTVSDIVKAYLDFAKEYYQPPSRESLRIQYAVKPLMRLCGSTPVEDFGPLKLQEYQECLVKNGLTRNTVNNRTNVIKRMFKWAASQELISVVIQYGLSAVGGLKRGRTKAKQSKVVKPIAEEACFDKTWTAENGV